jgi:hypothetical protein
MKSMNLYFKLPNSQKQQNGAWVSPQKILISTMVVFVFISCNTPPNGGANENSNAQTLIGTWETIDFKTSNGSPMSYQGIVWVFSESKVRYFDNGVEVMGRPFTYQWTSNDTIRMTDDVTNDQRNWRLRFNDNNNLIVNDIPSGYIRKLVRIPNME